ncbi:MAG: hypothetical protein ACLQVJ_22280 [Syntrophobacteraceae bacterium]
MKLDHIISFSLYGSNPLYCEGALQNVELAIRFYREWVCRFYIDDTVPEDCVARLVDMGAQVIRVQKKLGPVYGRYWRFWVAADSGVSRYLIRDADSRLNPRERAAVDEWVLSGKSFHVMRDSFAHHKRMLGGMWGGSGAKLRNIAELIDNWGRFDEHGQTDQFVSEIIYPIIKNDYFCHDSIGHFKKEESQDFPAHPALEGTSFVGEIVKLDRHFMDIRRRTGEINEKHLLLEEELNGRIHRLESDLAKEQSHDFPAHPALEGSSFVGEIDKLDQHCMDIWRRLGELDDKHLLLQKRLTRRIHRLESDLAAFWVAKLQLTQEGQDRAVNLLGLTRIVRHCRKGRWPLIGWLLRLWYRHKDKRLIVRSLVTTTAGRRPAGSGEHLFSVQTSCGKSSREG